MVQRLNAEIQLIMIDYEELTSRDRKDALIQRVSKLQQRLKNNQSNLKLSFFKRFIAFPKILKRILRHGRKDAEFIQKIKIEIAQKNPASAFWLRQKVDAL